MDNFDSLLLEALDSKTDRDRLYEIEDSELSTLDQMERSRLISVLVDHPNWDEDLCEVLLWDWPNEALACTRFQQLLMSDSAISWVDIFERIFDEFSAMTPVLASLANIPKLHKSTVKLFEAELLRFNSLSCSFDWISYCSHKVNISWKPLTNKEEAEKSVNECNEISQAFSINCSATISSGNKAILRSPSEIDNVGLLFAELDAQDEHDVVAILRSHGWDCETEETGNGGYFAIDSVAPDLGAWSFEASLDGNASGTLHITDPSGVEHECELPNADISDSFENYTLDDRFSLLDLFNNDQEALNGFRKIIHSNAWVSPG